LLFLVFKNFIDKLIGAQGARLLENENQFSSCDVTLSKPSLSCGTSGTGETPKGAKRQEANRTPRGKGAPEAEINPFKSSPKTPKKKQDSY
jgi:hypothetical protein